MAESTATVTTESTDSPESTGIVRTNVSELFEPPNVLKLAGGGVLGPVQVAYQTYGTLSPEKDNAVFVCHALTGDAHVAGKHSPEDEKSGWWDGLVGPGKGIDTDKYFVICANTLGGCQGTTGPGSEDPETGKPYGLSFPFITVADIVSVHAELCRSLGINKLMAVIGGSLGGMQVLRWAVQFPDMVHSAIVLASAAKLSAQGIAFNAVGRRAIYADPNFNNGNYYQTNHVPKFGLALARMIAHITYLSQSSIEKKFGRRLQHSEQFAFELLRETEFQIESYLHYQGEKFVGRFDANSYLYLTRAMDYFDLAADYGTLESAFAETSTRFLVASYTTDWLFPSSQSRDLVGALIQARKHVTAIEFESPYGHDAFLIELKQLQELVAPYLEQARDSFSDEQVEISRDK